MLKKETLSSQLEDMADPQWTDHRVKSVHDIAHASAWLRECVPIDPLSPADRELTAEARRFSAVTLTDDQRTRFFHALFPKLAGLMERVWQRLPHQTYQRSMYERSPFRAPRHGGFVASLRNRWIRGVCRELSGHDPDPIWLATWGAHIRWSGVEDSALLLSCAMDQPGPVGDEVFEILKASASGTHKIGGMGQHVVTAMHCSEREEAWAFLEKMLLAAQRQEGLRQSILEPGCHAHPVAFRRLLRLILEENLVRFASTVRAIDVWFGFQWESMSTAHAKSILERVLPMLDDPAARDEAIRGKDPESAYLALWCRAHEDAQAAADEATKLLSHTSADKRWVGLYALESIGFSEYVPAVIPALDDADASVAAQALVVCATAMTGRETAASDEDFDDASSLPDADQHGEPDSAELSGLLDAIERLLGRISGKELKFKPRVFPWGRSTLTAAEVGATLTHCCPPQESERLVGILDRLDSHSRGFAAMMIAGQPVDAFYSSRRFEAKPLTPLARATLISLLGDPAKDVRSAVARILELEPATPEEIARHESLLDRAADDIRARAIARVVTLPDAAALQVASRLLSGKNARQTAGLEVLRTMVVAGRSVEDVRTLTRPLRDGGKALGKDPQKALDAIFDGGPAIGIRVDDAFGLARVGAPRPLPVPRDRSISPLSKAAVACVLSLDALVHANATMELKTDHPRQGDLDEHRLLGSIQYTWQFAPRRSIPDRSSPVSEILEPWLAQRGPDLRDDDGLELLRAWALVTVGTARRSGKGENAFARTLQRHAPAGHDGTLVYADAVGLILEWALKLHPPAGAIAFLLDGMESAIARGELIRLSESTYAAEYDFNDLLWSAHTWRGLLQSCPAAWSISADVTTLERYEGLIRSAAIALTKGALHDESAGSFTVELDDFMTLWRTGRVSDDELLVRLVTGQEGGYRRSFSDLGRLFELRKPGKSTQHRGTLTLTPQLDALLERLRRRVLEIELGRGDAETPATRHAMAMDPSGGIDAAVPALARLGKRSLIRGYIYNDWGKAASMSTIIRNSRPGPGDTPEAFAKAARDAGLSDQRLVELALYQPRWAAHVQHATGWPMLEDAVLWLRTHTKERKDGYRIDEDQELWEARAGELTPITRESLSDGAVDRAWFERCHSALGPKRWEVLYEAAKFASSGAGHTRARLFADAILGNITEKQLTLRITGKRHQDSARALGLLAIKPGDAGKKQVMARFKVLQEMRRTSSKHGGAMLQASEKRAVEIGMENLAWTAGYPDPLRLQWAMEIQDFADLANGPITVTVGEVAVSLAVDDDGAPSLTSSRKGKALKSVPPDVKKDKRVAALQQRMTELRRQTTRVRSALELAMCRGDAFSGADLPPLFDHPVLRRLLSRLVFIGKTRSGGSLLGYPDKNGKALRSVTGAIEPLRATDELRVAHPLDLLKTAQWHAWQRECFAAERVQPFKQVFREVYVPVGPELGDASGDGPSRSRRYAGQQVQPRQAIALFGSRGWVARHEEGIQRTFHAERLTAQVAFEEGFYTPAEIDGFTIDGLAFFKAGTFHPVPIAQVPPRVFSEVMRDMDLVVSVAHRGGVDPEASQSTVELRASLLRETCELLSLGNVAIEGPRALIQGELARYALHLGSGSIHTLPGGHLWIIPVHSQHRGRLFLPFADDDPKTAEIISKALLLARDREIQDPAILAQIRNI